ncbi:DUF3140 domain-containing protein [Actinomycetospora lutea]|nr:DUF3140 domain-containing protein [Actinomycetospora lutea]MDD7942793.1 DUF3140 domain-containing protein [Actinomycetospora lutea]
MTDKSTGQIRSELDDDDLAAMTEVHGYVARHREQEPSQEELTTFV